METKKSYESVIQYPLEDEEKSQHDAAHKLESGETNDKAELDLVDHPQLYNRILCGVFFIYAFYMGIKCWALWTIVTNSSDDDRIDMNMRYHIYGLAYFIATTYIAAASRKYHHRFPQNLMLLVGVFSGVTILFTLQVIRFDAEHLHVSDIPAIQFGFASFVLLWLFSFVIHFPSTTYMGLGMRLLIVALTAGVSTIAYDLDKFYRFVALIPVGLGVVYCILRAEILARRAQRDFFDSRIKNEDRSCRSNSNVWINSISISLQIILWPLIVISGLITFSCYVQRPILPWPSK